MTGVLLLLLLLSCQRVLRKILCHQMERRRERRERGKGDGEAVGGGSCCEEVIREELEHKDEGEKEKVKAGSDSQDSAGRVIGSPIRQDVVSVKKTLK